MALSDIQTMIIVIMENRSFDHMLGYLSLDGAIPVEGLKASAAWQASFANEYSGKRYPSFPIALQSAPCSDPQHDRQSIALQISKPPAGPGVPSMGGFVESYATLSDPVPTDPSAVMGYFQADSVPTFDFLARNYCVCDHWFSSLPLGTQANRLMAMAGESSLLDNAGVFLPEQSLVYDWLTAHGISWCAYQAGDFLPFFSLMASWLPEITTSLTLNQVTGGGGRFRRYANFKTDWNSATPVPSVIFLEPEYTDGPHADPNDDHAPTGIQPGQAFLADIYQTLIGNPARWANTLLVVTYDEHGGFFDHVPPLNIPTTIAGATLNTTGIRVPAFLVSPYVKAGSVFTGLLDHTSLLQLLDDKFLKGEGYSDAVNRRQANFNRILNALDSPARQGAAPQLPRPAGQAVTQQGVPVAPDTPNARAFDAAARKMASDHPELLSRPGWEKMNRYLGSPRR